MYSEIVWNKHYHFYTMKISYEPRPYGVLGFTFIMKLPVYNGVLI